MEKPIYELELSVDKPVEFALTLSTERQINMGMDTAIVIGTGVPYTGEYTVIPKAHEETVLATKGKKMNDNVTVVKIPYWETSNTHGYTAYIAEDINDGN